MIVSVDGVEIHASTGGVASAAGGPVVVLIHGAGIDSTVWQLQTRYLAYRGMRAMAVDLPGHGRSGGEALGSVEEMADWLVRFLDAAGVAQAHIVGHSMGSFVALELASRYGARTCSVTLCGTSTSMAVHPDLLDAATNDLGHASALMAAWGHARPAHVGLNPTPGMWMLGGARALVELSRPGVLATDFRACMAYANAVSAAAMAVCPATVIIGLGDKMTPPKGGRTIAAALRNVTAIELADVGHSMMIESPRAVRDAIVNRVSATSISNTSVNGPL